VRLEGLFIHRLVRLFQVVLPLVVILLIAIPAWNYLAKIRQKSAPARQGRKLPSGVSVHTDGFTFSQTEGGRTSYTVRAKTYLDVKDNKSMLEDVDVTVYSATEKVPTRTIRGKHCTFDQDTSDFECMENVQIQLDPRTTIYTEELFYNHKDAVATSQQHAHLEQEGTTGEADRFEYGVNSGLLKLYGHIKIDTPQHTELQTDSAIFQQNEHWTTMAGGVFIQSPGGWIRGTTGRADLTPETFKPKVITLQDNVTGESHPQGGNETLKVRGDWLNATISPEGNADQVLTRGNAELEKIAGDQHQRLTGAEIDMTFNSGNRVEVADARQNARMIMGKDQILESSEILTNAGGIVQTRDKSVLKLGDSTIEGREFHIENGEDVVTFDTSRPAVLKKEGDQESSADQTNARFDSRTNMLIELVQIGHFQFRTPQYQGHANQGTSKDNIVVLEGGAPVVDASDKHIEAARIQLNQQDNSFVATKDVRTVMKNSDQPIKVKAASAEGGSESMLYKGNVQLWRGDTYIKADRLTASGGGEQNTKVHAEAAAGGKVESTLKNVHSKSETLDYDEAGGTVHYTGHVWARKQDMIVEAPDMIVHSHDQTVTEIVASGGVKVTREDQIGTGERAVYDGTTDIVTLTGKPAQVRDPERGLSQGPLLEMLNKAKNVLVQGGNGERTVTQHPVVKK
jgi:LPS export ABC transporter protein LptC/lipopolysaccharide transport protein LptA